MVAPLRHSQTKEAETDMFDLQPPRNISTLQCAPKARSISGGRTHPSIASPHHGIRIVTFEACSGFTHVTGRRIAQPPTGDLLSINPVADERLCAGNRMTYAPARSAGVVGTACRKGGSGNRGRPVWCEGRGLNVASGGGIGGSR